MKHYLIIFFFLFPYLAKAQQNIDSLKKNLSTATDDSSRHYACWLLYNYYEETNRDSALFYAEQELVLSQKNKKKLSEVLSLNHKAYQLQSIGRYAESLQNLLLAFDIAENKKIKEKNGWIHHLVSFSGDNRLYMLSYTHHVFALLMYSTGNREQEVFHFKEAKRIAEQIGYTIRQQMAAMNLGRSYTNLNTDSALIFVKEAEQLGLKTNFKKYLGQIYNILAGIYNKIGDKIKTREYYYKGIQASIEQKNMNMLSNSYYLLSKYWLREGEKDSALKYALKNLYVFQTLGGIYGGATINLGNIYQNIYLCYKLNNQPDSAYKYQGLALYTIDSLSKTRIKNLTDFQNTGFNEQLRLQHVEKEKVVYQNKVRTWFLLGGIGLLLLLAVIFYRNNRQKHKARIKIEKAYNDLKATQQQLVQSEKMASLGELTAGIAHEIQNPLNFVNNFSDVNTELVDELKLELATGNMQSAMEIADNIKDNEQKINHHGKRADAIVKGMLQHSRSSSGVKETTDINALCDEYLRLAYHGLRAKDKSFNATMKTDFDKSIGNINIIPQEIGRVVLNLINNAFYAVDEKKKAERITQNAESYEPTVTVSTKKINGKVEIKIADNGKGIPQKILDKIFQPFFTTKPTGQGTGLGLSLAYDIVTKGHGGQVTVETEQGIGTTFIIQLSTQ